MKPNKPKVKKNKQSTHSDSSKTIEPIATQNSDKLQKILAQQGLGSRRKMETLIAEGRVRLNGKVAKIGDRAGREDRISVDEKPLNFSAIQPTRVLVYNKPIGQVCSRQDEKGRETVYDNLPTLRNDRWVSVGRLDITTSGLLLFTNNGQLAHRLMHPSITTDREYSVRIFGSVDEAMLQRLREGVQLEDGLSKFSDIVINNERNGMHQEGVSDKHLNHWFTVCLQSGKNREVRRLWESQQVQVNRLKRVRYGPVYLPSFLPQGHWMDLEPKDIIALCEHCDIDCDEVYLPTPQQKKIAERKLQKMRASKLQH